MKLGNPTPLNCELFPATPILQIHTFYNYYVFLKSLSVLSFPRHALSAIYTTNGSSCSHNHRPQVIIEAFLNVRFCGGTIQIYRLDLPLLLDYWCSRRPSPSKYLALLVPPTTYTG